MRQHHIHDPTGLGYYTCLCVISGNHHITVLCDLDNIDNILYLDFHYSILSVPYGGYSINASCALNLISTFSLQKSDQSGEFLIPVCRTL
jgi:hypothetical protein